MNAEQLRASILQLAIQGKLVEQRAEEGSSQDLFDKIQKEKQELIKAGKLKKEKSLPEISDDAPFSIPEKWGWFKLNDIQELVRGITFPASAKKSESSEGVVRCLTTGSVQAEHNESSDVFIDMGYVKKDNKFLRKGDVVISSANSRELVGKSIFWNFDRIGFSFGGFLTVARVKDPSVISYKYLYFIYRYLFESGYFRNLCTQTINIANLSNNIINEIYVPLPPLEEQKRIVKRIEELLPLVEQYGEAKEKLDAMNKSLSSKLKASILQEAIQGKLVEQRTEEGSAQELFDKIQKEKQELIRAGKLKKEKALPEISEDEIPFEIPESWILVRLNDLTSKDIKRGKSPKYCTTSDVLVFAQKCNSKYDGIKLELAKYLDQNSIPKYNSDEFIKDRDIIINSTGGGTMGRVGLYQTKDQPYNTRVVPDSHITVVRVFKSIESKFVYYFLKSKQKYLERCGEGSTNQTELKPDKIKNLLIPLPPLEEQKRIVAKVEQLFSLIDKMTLDIDSSESL